MDLAVQVSFVFQQAIASHLEELAQASGQSTTSLIEEMIEERYRCKRVADRLEAFDRTIEIANGIGAGLFKDKTVQSIKAEMDV